MANQAIFEIIAKFNAGEIDRELRRLRADVGRFSTNVRTGSLRPSDAQTAIIERAAPIKAAYTSLLQQGVSATELAGFKTVLDQIESVFVRLGGTTRKFDSALGGAANRLLKEKGAGEQAASAFEKKINSITSRTESNEQLLDTPAGQQSRADLADSARRLREDDRRLTSAARRKYADEIDANDLENAQLKARENKALQQALQGDEDYIRNTADATVARRKLTAEIQALVQPELAASKSYIKNTALAAEARRRIGLDVSNLVERARAANPRDSQVAGENAYLRQSRATREALVAEQFIEADTRLARQTTRLALLRQRRATREESALLTASRGEIGREAALANQRLQRANALAAEQARLNESTQFVSGGGRGRARHAQDIENQATVEAAKIRDDAERRAQTVAQNVQFEDRIRANLATVEAAERRRALAVREQVRVKLGAAFVEREAAEEVAQTAVAERRRLSVINRTLAHDQGLLRLKGESLVANKLLVQAERKLAQETLQAALKAGQFHGQPLARGTLYQRFQAGIAARQGGEVRLPTDYATIGQTARASLLTSARFAASGALLYGGVQAISAMINEAEELERTLNQVRRQFESLGKADQFAGFRESILRIARDTGAAANDVAFVGFQLQGAFGGSTQRALRETESAFRAVRVTGLEITEVIDAFTALTENFNDTAVTIEQVSDSALGLQERFGVLAEQTISFAADLAPVAAQAGFTVQNLEALGAVAQKYSGRSGSSLAEAFGRIIPSIQANAAEFYLLFDQLGDTDLSGQIAEAFREGNIASFFELLLQNYNKLGDAQKNQAIELLGGRREAQALIPVLENSSELLAEFARETGDAGKTAAYFGDLQTTLNQQLAEFGERISQVGIKLFNSGIKDFLEDIIGAASLLVNLFADLVGGISDVGGALGSIPGVGGGLGAIVEALLLYKGLGAIGRFAGARLGGGVAAGAVAGSGLPSSGATNQVFGAAAATAVAPAGARAAFTAARTAALANSASAGAAVASGLGAGLRTAITGFNWPILGATIGLLIAQELSTNAQEAAARRISELVGPDQRVSDQESFNLSREAGFDEHVTEDARVAGEAYAEIRSQLNAENLTINELRDRMRELVGWDASPWQQVIDAAPLGNLSQDLNRKRDAVEALFNEMEKTRPIEALQAVIANDALILEMVREGAPGLEEEDPAAFAARAQTIREELGALIADIEAGTATTDRIDNYMNALFGADGESGVVSRLMRSINDKAERQAQEAYDLSQRVLGADEALALFESGEIGLAQVRAALRDAIAAGREIGSTDPEDKAELVRLIQQEREIQGEALLAQADALIQSSELAGGSPLGSLDIRLGVLRRGGLTAEQERRATQDALEALEAVHDARVQAADTAAEEARILAEGTPIPPELRANLIEQYLTTANIRFNSAVTRLAGGNNELIRTITNAVAEIYATTGGTLEEALDEAVRLQRAILEKRADFFRDMIGLLNQTGLGVPASLKDQLVGVIDQINNLGNPVEIFGVGDLGDVPDFDRVGGSAEEIAAANERAAEEGRRAAEEAAQEAHNVRLAQLELQRALVEGDPVAEAAIERQIQQENLSFARAQGDRAAQIQAQAGLIRAQRQRQEAISEITLAQSDLNLALRGDDPVGAAFDELVQANEAVALARGAAARLEAQAAQVRAQRGLQEALQAIGIAQLSLAQAFADAAGDSVESARIALQIAEQQLSDLRRNAPNDEAAILEAQANIVAQQASLRDTDLNERQRAIDVALQLERITVQQAIAQLQALLQIPNLTQEQIDNLLIRIKQMQDELGGDYRFNLPTTFDLPTAYEARRFDQTPRDMGYNDNRQISVQVYADTNASPEAIAAAVGNVVGQPSRYGTAVKRY